MSAAAGAALFEDHERLGRVLPGYAPRDVQSTMAAAAARAIDESGRLVVEAGTGTGKTLAYLLPALASGRKIIVSTATRYLQEQLSDKDVPLAEQVLGRSVHTSVLKGRGNYLCLQRLELTESSGDLYFASRLKKVRAWAARTRTGDLGELGDIADGDALWPRITSTTDICLGSECPLFDQCWVVAARREALAADLVIVNHYLLFADLTLRERGFGEVLPGADAIILDEAHKLPDIAGRFFGQAVSGRQLRDFTRDGRAEIARMGGDMPELDTTLGALALAERAFGEALGAGQPNRAWADMRTPEMEQALAQLSQDLDDARDQIEPTEERSEAFKALARRAAELVQRLTAVSALDADSVSWLETRGQGWSWHSTPLDVATPFARAIERYPGAWIFTSATLAVDDSLAYFCDRLGLVGTEQQVLASPFDYERNALLYAPAAMPAPQAPHFDDAVIDECIGLIEAAGGGAFVLCTSYRAVGRYGQALGDAGLRPLIQGSAPRAELLARFRARDDGVLVATSSFWEGVDVRGRGLRLVIIDRLPFASPAEPVLAARFNAMKEAGGNPFMDYQLPQAVIALKQGVGRLIRDIDDPGVLAICDPRLYTARYGAIIRKSLPPMPVTRDPDQAYAFLTQLAAA